MRLRIIDFDPVVGVLLVVLGALVFYTGIQVHEYFYPTPQIEIVCTEILSNVS